MARYYPKNKIKTNLYTRGNEFVNKSTKDLYVGHYWSTFDGKFFSGTNPNETPNFELEKITVNKNNNDPNFDKFVDTKFSINNYYYTKLKGKDILSPSPITPTPYYPQPTEDDYKLGEFQRYFCVKANELIYTEVTKDQYEKFKNKDESVAWQYYIAFSIPWDISGDKKQVYKTNRNIVLIQEQNNKRRGLQEFLRKNYLKFYQYKEQNNLYTSGSELKDKNNKIYIGYYHINKTMGPMEGKYHSNSPHDKLSYINEQDIEPTPKTPTPPPPNTEGYSVRTSSY